MTICIIINLYPLFLRKEEWTPNINIHTHAYIYKLLPMCQNVLPTDLWLRMWPGIVWRRRWLTVLCQLHPLPTPRPPHNLLSPSTFLFCLPFSSKFNIRTNIRRNFLITYLYCPPYTQQNTFLRVHKEFLINVLVYFSNKIFRLSLWVRLRLSLLPKDQSMMIKELIVTLFIRT